MIGYQSACLSFFSRNNFVVSEKLCTFASKEEKQKRKTNDNIFQDTF
jgi:hypothetical protein